ASEVNASPSLTALTVTATFDPVTAVGESHADATPAALTVTSTYPGVSVTGEVNAVAAGTALEAAALFPPATATGQVNADANPTSLAGLVTFPATSYFIDSQTSLTALQIQAALPLVVTSAGSTVGLTTLEALIWLPHAQGVSFVPTTKGYVAVSTVTVGGVAITDAIAGGEGYIDTYRDHYGIQVGGDVTLTDRLAGVLSLL
ncbi:unnamed protein product, partial [marine sediment metagenome]